jgi:hypothetical protein
MYSAMTLPQGQTVERQVLALACDTPREVTGYQGWSIFVEGSILSNVAFLRDLGIGPRQERRANISDDLRCVIVR